MSFSILRNGMIITLGAQKIICENITPICDFKNCQKARNRRVFP